MARLRTHYAGDLLWIETVCPAHGPLRSRSRYAVWNNAIELVRRAMYWEVVDLVCNSV